MDLHYTMVCHTLKIVLISANQNYEFHLYLSPVIITYLFLENISVSN